MCYVTHHVLLFETTALLPFCSSANRCLNPMSILSNSSIGSQISIDNVSHALVPTDLLITYEITEWQHHAAQQWAKSELAGSRVELRFEKVLRGRVQEPDPKYANDHRDDADRLLERLHRLDATHTDAT